MNTNFIIENIIGLSIALLLTYKSINNAPITVIPIELLILVITNPFNNNNQSKTKIDLIKNIIYCSTFYLHLIRFIYRFLESYTYTRNNKVITLVSIILIIMNYLRYKKNKKIKNNENLTKTDYILIVLNGIFQFVAYINNKKNALIDWKIDVLITLSFILFITFNKILHIKLTKMNTIVLYSEFVYHILEFIYLYNKLSFQEDLN